LVGAEVRWVEVCYCPTPLEEERPYWEEFFELDKVQDAHDRRQCHDFNGREPWACGDCEEISKPVATGLADVSTTRRLLGMLNAQISNDDPCIVFNTDAEGEAAPLLELG